MKLTDVGELFNIFGSVSSIFILYCKILGIQFAVLLPNQYTYILLEAAVQDGLSKRCETFSSGVSNIIWIMAGQGPAVPTADARLGPIPFLSPSFWETA